MINMSTLGAPNGVTKYMLGNYFIFDVVCYFQQSNLRQKYNINCRLISKLFGRASVNM